MEIGYCSVVATHQVVVSAGSYLNRNRKRTLAGIVPQAGQEHAHRMHCSGFHFLSKFHGISFTIFFVSTFKTGRRLSWMAREQGVRQEITKH